MLFTLCVNAQNPIALVSNGAVLYQKQDNIPVIGLLNGTFI